MSSLSSLCEPATEFSTGWRPIYGDAFFPHWTIAVFMQKSVLWRVRSTENETYTVVSFSKAWEFDTVYTLQVVVRPACTYPSTLWYDLLSNGVESKEQSVPQDNPTWIELLFLSFCVKLEGLFDL